MAKCIKSPGFLEKVFKYFGKWLPVAHWRRTSSISCSELQTSLCRDFVDAQKTNLSRLAQLVSLLLKELPTPQTTLSGIHGRYEGTKVVLQPATQ